MVQGCDCNLRTEEGGEGEGCQCRLDTSTIAAMIKMMQTKKETSAHRHRFAHFVSVCRKLDKIFSLSSSVLSCSQSGVTRIGVTKKYTPIAQKTGNTGKQSSIFRAHGILIRKYAQNPYLNICRATVSGSESDEGAYAGSFSPSQSGLYGGGARC